MTAMKRISCPGFAIIRDDQGRYGLISDMETNQGLLPIGGALHADASGLLKLINDFGAPSRSFENGAALRFAVPEDKVTKVSAWFASRIGRDLAINRVLHRSLFDETAVLTRREASEFEQRVAGYDGGTGPTFRDNIAERDTVYMIELYAVSFPVQTMAKLKRQAAARRSHFRFATADEIRSGRLTKDGTPISSIATSLLNPSRQLRTS